MTKSNEIAIITEEIERLKLHSEMSDRPTPETDAENAQFAIGGFTLDFCRKLERERDEAREENKKFREALEWIAERYDDSKPMHQVAMDAYEMSCTARAALRKEETK